MEISYTITKVILIVNELLNRTANHNIDMLVILEYGHFRFRETVLGGTNRYILRCMTVSTMLAH